VGRISNEKAGFVLIFEARRLYGGNLFWLFTALFAGTLSRQRLFYPALLARLQVKGVTFDIFNDVLGLHFALKTAQGVFQRFTFLQSNFCQKISPPNQG
jgi:hypothetical protein